mmetsp:Transcript_7261/g.10814  ORF Transcript_7261/g.10814 Transcript_7261/m.10814 type:complete len:250 (+) Transcript_7261:154-903(+)
MFDTDVNAPALAEYMWHKGKDETSCAYITVGTGIGVGLVVNGAPVHGLLHPEAGHLSCQRMEGDNFEGTDTLFGASIEGLTATPALAARKNCEREELKHLADNDKMWDYCAHSLASLIVSLVLVASPERIYLSGGVMNRKIIYPKVHDMTLKLLHGYIVHPKLTPEGIARYITPSNFDQEAGIIGALTLAHCALNPKESDQSAPRSITNPIKKGSKCSEKVTLAVGIAIGTILTGLVLIVSPKMAKRKQ